MLNPKSKSEIERREVGGGGLSNFFKLQILEAEAGRTFQASTFSIPSGVALRVPPGP